MSSFLQPCRTDEPGGWLDNDDSSTITGETDHLYVGMYSFPYVLFFFASILDAPRTGVRAVVMGWCNLCVMSVHVSKRVATVWETRIRNVKNNDLCFRNFL